jgi:hypothetical protein
MLLWRHPHLQSTPMLKHCTQLQMWKSSVMRKIDTISSTCASDHMLRLLISSTFGCDVEASSFIGSPSGLKTRTSAPNRSRILRQQQLSSVESVPAIDQPGGSESKICRLTIRSFCYMLLGNQA